MHNDLLTIGNITVHGYGLMIAIGIVVAYFVVEYRTRRQKLETKYIFPLLCWGVGFGLVGAKVLYWLTILDEIKANPRIMLNIADGFVVYGGIILGIIVGFIFCKVKKIRFFAYLDLILPSVALAQGFGRMGCFLAGCCYGVQTDSAFAITFTNSDFAPNGVPLVPTQLMSSAFDVANFIVLCLIARMRPKRGKVSACYLIIYGVGRFLIEFVRGDLARGSIGALSTSQFISLFIVAFGVVLFILVSIFGKLPEPDMYIERETYEE